MTASSSSRPTDSQLADFVDKFSKRVLDRQQRPALGERDEILERGVVAAAECGERLRTRARAVRDEVADRRERVQAVRELRSSSRRDLPRELHQVAKPVDGWSTANSTISRAHSVTDSGESSRLRRCSWSSRTAVRDRAQRDVDLRAADLGRVAPLRLDPALVAAPASRRSRDRRSRTARRVALQAGHPRAEPRVHVVLEHLHPQRDRRRQIGVGLSAGGVEQRLGGAQAASRACRSRRASSSCAKPGTRRRSRRRHRSSRRWARRRASRA